MNNNKEQKNYEDILVKNPDMIKECKIQENENI